MPVRFLDWDTKFFGYRICSVHWEPSYSLDYVSQSLIDKHTDLAYIFIENLNDELHNALHTSGAHLLDEKVTFHLQFSGLEKLIMPEGISEYFGPSTTILIDLAILAGHESRFRKDPKLSSFFYSLYNSWLNSSLDRSFADCVFVSYDPSGVINGFVSCQIKNQIGNISLIAVAPNYQGIGIGKKLLNAVHFYYQNKGILISTVVTQKSNQNAYLFYHNNGYTVQKVEKVYHWWLKNSI